MSADAVGGEPINARTTRMNHLILGRPGATSKVAARSVIEALSREGLLDALCLLFDECNKDYLKKKDRNIFDFVNKYRDVIKEAQHLRVNIKDFHIKSLIGKGYFGEVHLAAEKSTKDIYAIKKIRKSLTCTSAQVKEERDIMAYKTSEWITSLQYAFQDHDHLYLVMEYLPGGDLLSLMIRHGAFDEELARSYLAELTQALHALHQMGYVHRDIKPDNILLDRCGHLKLADFGSAAALNKNGTAVSLMPVGTPDYIAPELLDTLQTSTTSASAATTSSTTRSLHDATCDFWSMGIIGYELVSETTPFHADSVTDTYDQIRAHVAGNATKRLTWPTGVEVSTAFASLIDGLVARRSKRLTYGQIKQHAFFRDIAWDTLRLKVPPIIPSVNGEDDTSNFEAFDTKARRSTYTKSTAASMASSSTTSSSLARGNDFSGQNLPFLGYSYVHEECSDDDAGIGMGSTLSPATSTSSVAASLSTVTSSHGVGREAELQRQRNDLQKKVDIQTAEIKKLQADLLSAERKSAKTELLEKILLEAKNELTARKDDLKAKTVELAACTTEIKTLRRSLQIVEQSHEKRDAEILDVVSSTYQKWERVKQASDKNFQTQLHSKTAELAAVADKLQTYEQELAGKGEECVQLHERVRKYKEQLREAKEQLAADQTAQDQSKRQLTDAYENKVRELKAKLQQEKEAKVGAIEELATVRRDLAEIQSSAQNAEHSRRAVDRNADAIRTRLNQQIVENHTQRDQTASAERKCVELQQRLDATIAEVAKLKADHQKAVELAAKHPLVSRRSSGAASDIFRSAHGSIESLNSIVEEQLRNDLTAAKENECAQRQRADRLEDAVARMEEAINRLQPKPQDALLERQNSKLEDQLASVREQAIVERQASRTAHLSLYKLEKQLDDLNDEKKRSARRIELAEERFAKLRTDKEEADRQLRDATAAVQTKQDRIDELLAQIRDHKADVKHEHSMWERAEQERMHAKAEIVEQLSRLHQLDQRNGELVQKLKLAEARLDAMAAEHKRVLKERFGDRRELCAAEERCARADAELLQLQRSNDLLKHTCTVLETQLNELEAMLEAETAKARAHAGEIESLRSAARERSKTMQAVRQQLDGETVAKQQLETRLVELELQLQEVQDEKAAQHLQLIDTQETLVGQTDGAYKAQEAVAVLTEELRVARHLNANCERELHIIKEENARVLTDLYLAKDELNRQAMAFRDSISDGCELRNELEQLKGTMAEQKNYYMNRDIKAEATLEQMKKLVNYLQQRVQEMDPKKKKKTGFSIKFNSKEKEKENQPPPFEVGDAAAQVKKVQEELRRERQRCAQLKEQLIQAKADIQTGGATAVEEVVAVPSAPSVDEFSYRRETEKPTKSAARAEQQQAHRFEMTLEAKTAANADPPFVPCIVCGKQIDVERSFQRCKGCKSAVHRRCHAEVRTTCEAEELKRMQHVQMERGSVNSGLDVVGGGSTDEDDAAVTAAIGSDAGSELAVGLQQREYSGDVVLRSADVSPPVSVNCVLEVSDGVLLLGTESGLYSFHTKQRQLVQIPPLSNVSCIAQCKVLSKCLLIGDNGRQLYVVELNHLHSRAQANACLRPKLDVSKIDLTLSNRQPSERWLHVFVHAPPAPSSSSSSSNSEAHAIACTASRLVIMRYDAAQGRFKPVCALDTAKPVASVLFTSTCTVLVGSDKFFEIDLQTFQAEEFLDESDASCVEARTVCRPHSVFRVNSQEFLLCFLEFGVFVDTYGDRSRPNNVTWAGQPTAFVYRDPLLFVSYRNMVEVVRINKSYRSDVEQMATASKPLRSYLTLAEPRLVGESAQFGAYVLSTVAGSTGGRCGDVLMSLDGIRSLKTTVGNSTETLLSSVAGHVGAGSSESLSTVRDSELGDESG